MSTTGEKPGKGNYPAYNLETACILMTVPTHFHHALNAIILNLDRNAGSRKAAFFIDFNFIYP